MNGYVVFIVIVVLFREEFGFNQLNMIPQYRLGTHFIHLLRAQVFIERIDPLRFQAGCYKRRLNQALYVFSVIISFIE